MDLKAFSGKRIGVAISGGADSVALLHYLKSRENECGYTLFAVHCEHGIRGEESLADMREKMKESMQAYANDRGEMELQDQLMRQAAESLEMEISQDQLDKAVQEQMQLLEAQLARQGLSMEMYCSFTGKEEKELCEDAVPAAEASIRAQAAIDKIVELEGITATEEDIGEALALIARQNRMPLDDLKAHYNGEMEQAVIRSVLTTKAMELIRANAEIVEE